MKKKRVAVLISGRGSNMAALIEAAQAPESVRARSTAKSARWAWEVHTFWPLTR